MTSTLCFTTMPSIFLGTNYVINILPISICYFFFSVPECATEGARWSWKEQRGFPGRLHPGDASRSLLLRGFPNLCLCFFWAPAPLIFSIPPVGRRTMTTLWTAGTRSWNGALPVSRGGGCSLRPSDLAWHHRPLRNKNGCLLDRWFSLEVEDLRQNKNVCCCVYATSISVVYVLCKLHTQSCRMWWLWLCLSESMSHCHWRSRFTSDVLWYVLFESIFYV